MRNRRTRTSASHLVGAKPHTLLLRSPPPRPVAVDPKRGSGRLGLLSQCLAQPLLVHAPEGVLPAVDENHGNLLPILVVKLLIEGNVLRLPLHPHLRAHLLHHKLCVITQVTPGLTNESDAPAL